LGKGVSRGPGRQAWAALLRTLDRLSPGYRD